MDFFFEITRLHIIIIVKLYATGILLVHKVVFVHFDEKRKYMHTVHDIVVEITCTYILLLMQNNNRLYSYFFRMP